VRLGYGMPSGQRDIFTSILKHDFCAPVDNPNGSKSNDHHGDTKHNGGDKLGRDVHREEEI
jgi:hypothetical protein